MALRKPKKDKQKKDAGNTPEKKTGGAATLIQMFAMMLLVFIVGAGMVVGYFKIVDPGESQAASAQKEAQEKEVVMTATELGDMVVNLADSSGSRFLKTKITIEYPVDKKAEELIAEKKHQVVEVVLLTLRKKTFADVSPPNATEKLKQELVEAINGQLNEDVVKKVYFTEYIVQ